MKIMKKTITIILCILSFAGFSIAQQIDQAEILIKNSTNHAILVKVFPVGAIFSGWFPDDSLNHKYSLKRSNQSELCHWPIFFGNEQFIVGGEKLILSNSFSAAVGVARL